MSANYFWTEWNAKCWSFLNSLHELEIGIRKNALIFHYERFINCQIVYILLIELIKDVICRRTFVVTFACLTFCKPWRHLSGLWPCFSITIYFLFYWNCYILTKNIFFVLFVWKNDTIFYWLLVETQMKSKPKLDILLFVVIKIS